MKKTIKQLESELKQMTDSRDKYWSKVSDLEEEKKEKLQYSMNKLKDDHSDLSNQVRDLMEIIRWQINNETAKSPFMPNKSERDENRNRNFN